MEENQNHYQDHDTYDPYAERPSVMAAAAFALAIISVFSCMIFYISIPAGALAIILALLSRGNGPAPKRARMAITAAIIGCALSLFLTISAMIMMVKNPALRRQAEKIIEYYYHQEEGSLSDYFLNDTSNAPSSDTVSDPVSGKMPAPANDTAPAPDASKQKVQLHIADSTS